MVQPREVLSLRPYLRSHDKVHGLDVCAPEGVRRASLLLLFGLLLLLLRGALLGHVPALQLRGRGCCGRDCMAAQESQQMTQQKPGR
jgi:hypothetical protein